jgi:diguanylate cyclase (GGDEF)-like protein
VSASLAALHRDFAASLVRRVADLRQAVVAAAGDRTRVSDAVMLAHRLRGTAGAYGRADAGAAAGDVEDLLRPVAAMGGTVDAALAAACQSALARITLSDAGPAALPTPAAALPEGDRLLVVDDDPEVLRAIAGFARRHVLEVVPAANAAEAVERARWPRVAAAFLDLDPGGDDAFALARQLRALPGLADLPLAFVAVDQTLENRVAAAHAGASLFLDKPVTRERFDSAVDDLLRAADPFRDRVLALEDDPEVGAQIATVLGAERLAVRVIDDPGQLLAELESFRPTLLLLDVMLPRISGYDVCRALRTSQPWQTLPVLFLTARTDDHSRLEAYRAGGTDFIPKPVLPEELVVRVRMHLRHARAEHDQAERDSLTGLLLRRPFFEGLEQRLAEARRRRHPLGLALLDLDFFKRINDTYGHLVGDQVLASLGHLMRQRFRLEDLRGRWGGEEFVAAFPAQSGAVAAGVVDRLRAEFAAIPFRAADGTAFHARFTAGIAAFPDDGASIHDLIRTADERLGTAKRAGRDRVVGAPSTASEPTPRIVRRVLVIDDDSDLRRLTQIILERLGPWEAHVAASGEEGIAQALEHRPDCILLDLEMPGLDGLATLARLRAQPELQDTPVIMLSAGGPRVEERCRAAGAQGFIHKPCDPAVLPAEIRRLLALPQA